MKSRHPLEVVIAQALSKGLRSVDDPHAIKVRLGMTLREIEYQAIVLTLEQCGGNATVAARSLEIDRSTLKRKLARRSGGNRGR